MLDPDRDRVFNELSWENGPDPFRWQPTSTVFQEVLRDGVEVTRIGPGFFDGSGLTNAALRGGRFRAASSLADRVDAAVDARRGLAARSLVYLYWGELDKVGHVHGPASWEWVDELESVDRHLSSLAARVPAGTAIHVTADHGMVDVPFAHRVDLADEPDLLAGVRHVGGEPRATQLYLRAGHATGRGRAAGGATGWPTGPGWGPVTRLVDAGLVRCGAPRGPGPDRGRPRRHARRRSRSSTRPGCDPSCCALRGLHGSVTDEERGLPFVTRPGRVDGPVERPRLE